MKVLHIQSSMPPAGNAAYRLSMAMRKHGIDSKVLNLRPSSVRDFAFMDLKHKGINCVKKENMKSLILVFKDGNNWILYGIGGVKAPKIPLFEKRIETSFMNKIKTFCQFVYSKL